jgi:hypothetical protein
MTTIPYRPSNGTEGDLFHSWFCFRCQHESEASPCDILSRSLAFALDRPEYPTEWIEDDVPYPQYSNPRCTAFLAEGAEGSTYVKDERQLELSI